MTAKRILLSLVTILTGLGLWAGGGHLSRAAESGSSAKSKGKSTPAAAADEAKKGASESTKTKSKSKAKSKSGESAKGSKADDEAELKQAEALLKDLSTSKKTSLTKLLNSGDKKELMQLPGIGDATADAIIKARPLESAAHLILVKGIGEKTFGEIVKSRK